MLSHMFNKGDGSQELFYLARNLKGVLPSAVSRIKIAHSEMKALTSFAISFSILFLCFFQELSASVKGKKSTTLPSPETTGGYTCTQVISHTCMPGRFAIFVETRFP